MKTFVHISIVAAALYVALVVAPGLPHFGGDFRNYFDAAHGVVYAYTPEAGGWLYPDWTRYAWIWTLITGYGAGLWVWFGLLTASYTVLAHNIMEYRHGWILALGGIKPFMLCLQTGNINPVLALAMLSPIGCILAGCFKLWPLGGLAGHLLLDLAGRGGKQSGWISLSSGRSVVSVDRAFGTASVALAAVIGWSLWLSPHTRVVVLGIMGVER